MLRIAKLSSLILGALVLVTVAKAEHHGKGIDVHGTLDVYWNHDFNKGNSTGDAAGPLEHDDLQIGLASFNFSGSSKNIDWFMELAFGDQRVGTAASNANSLDLAQAYLTHHFNDQLSLTAGRMNTNVGYEGAYAKDNWNYSRSLAFTYGSPLFHDGIALKYNHNSGFGAGFFYYDGEDEIDNNEPTHASSVQLSYSMDNWAVVYNYYTNKDAENTLLHNINFSYDLNAKLSFAFAYLMGEVDEDNATAEWSSMALYAKYMAMKDMYLALRLEQWADEGGVVFSGVNEEEVMSMTLTAGWYCNSGSEMRLEVRQDTADTNIYRDEDNTGSNNADSQMNVSASWIHSF